jgi:hypothetical protein
VIGLSGASIDEQGLQARRGRPRWVLAVAAVALVPLGAVGGAVFASQQHNDDPPPPTARASGQAQYLLAVAARLRAGQNQALDRTRTLDSQQLVTRVRLDAYQELVNAGQQRLDAYAPVAFRLRGVQIDQRTMTISEAPAAPRPSQSTLRGLVPPVTTEPGTAQATVAPAGTSKTMVPANTPPEVVHQLAPLRA